jgi:ABC-type sugar transport system permease subunit
MRWIVLAALLLPAAILIWILLLSFGEPLAGFPLSAHFALDNYLTAAHTYLLRNAMKHTLWLATGVSVVGLAGATLWAAWLPRRGWAARWVLALGLLPLWMPAAHAALAWRPLLANLNLLGETEPALLALGIFYLWRVLPVQILVLWGLSAVRSWRVYGLALLVAVYLVAGDAASVLMLTGGAPFNATHTLASWTFQMAWTARLWGHAAVSAAGLGVGLIGLVWVGVWLASPLWRCSRQVKSERPPVRSVFADLTALLALAVWTLAPMLLALWELDLAGFWTGLATILRTGYLLWLGNTVVVAAAAALLAGWFVRFLLAGQATGMAQKPLRLEQIIFVSGLVALPLWFLPFLWLRWTVTGVADSRFVQIAVYGVIAVAITLWPVSLLSKGQASRQARLLPVLAAGILALQDFTSSIVLAQQPADLLLGPAVAVHLAGNVTMPAALPAAVVVTVLLALAVSLFFATR